MTNHALPLGETAALPVAEAPGDCAPLDAEIWTQDFKEARAREEEAAPMTDGSVALMDALPWQHTEFMRCALDLARKLPENVSLLHASTNYHDEARNMFAESFEGDWLLMLDTDQGFHWNLVERIVAAADRIGADVLTGVYYRRMRPYWPLLYWHDREGNRRQYQELPGEEPFIVEACGAGCLFVRRRVFERLAEAFPASRPFDFIYPPGESRIAEDLSFCLRCLQAEIEVWCDPVLRTNHLTWFAVLPMMDREKVLAAGGIEEPGWPEQLEQCR